MHVVHSRGKAQTDGNNAPVMPCSHTAAQLRHVVEATEVEHTPQATVHL